MYPYMYETDYLAHYGTKGMKWGVRRAKLKDAKANYKRSVDDAYKRYEKGIAGVEKNYKRGQNLSDKDLTRESRIEDRYHKDVSDAKAAYQKTKRDIKMTGKSPREKRKQEFRDERANIAKSRSFGHKLATNILAGPLANRTYNSVLASGGSRTKALGVTAASAFLGGPVGHLVVSAVYTSQAGDAKR